MSPSVLPSPRLKTVAFGELLLRLSPPGFQRFVQTDRFDVHAGGAEANVAASLAGWGIESHFVTKLPAHEIGQAALNGLRRYGVRTEHVVRGGDRVGLYFLEAGASQRGPKVVYDRAGSALTTIRPGEIDWEAVFDGAGWFHWTGITAALGPGPHAVLVEALEAARARGVTVSCDLNHRAKLWSEDRAQTVMRPLMAHVDVCIANEDAAAKSLGLPIEPAGDTDTGTDEGGRMGARYVRLAERLRDEFGFATVALTRREVLSASRHGWSALALTGDAEPARSRRYDIALVDRVGGGDAFAAGFIYGMLARRTADGAADAAAAAEFAAAASCLKHTIPGDVNHVSVEEVDALAGGSGSGRVDR